MRIAAALATMLWAVCAVVQAAQSSGAPEAPSTFVFESPGPLVDGGYRSPLAISPDGSLLALAADNRIYSKRTADDPAAPWSTIPGTEGLNPTHPVFSPDGRSLAFWARAHGVVKRIPVDGGEAQDVYKPVALDTMSWGPGGDIVVGLGPGGIARVSAEDGAAETIVTMANGESAYHPQLLPGGDAVLFTLMTPDNFLDWDKASIVVQSIVTGARRVLVEGGSHGRYAPTGHVVFARADTLFAAPFDVARLEATGPETELLRGVDRRRGPDLTYETALYWFSDNGSLVYVSGGPYDPGIGVLEVVHRADGAVETLPLADGLYSTPRFSPDGQRIAYGMGDLREHNIYVYDLFGNSPPRRLTDGGVNTHPVWATDGRTLFFSSNLNGGGVFQVQADGGGRVVRLTDAIDGAEHHPTSFAGGMLLFNRVAQGKRDVWGYSMEEERAFPVLETPAAEAYGSLSPDGRWFTYMAGDADGNWQVMARPLSGGGTFAPVSTPEWFYPLWSRDGEEIFFFGNGPSFMAAGVRQASGRLDLQTAEQAIAGRTANPRPNAAQSNLAVWPHFYDVSPDGDRIIVERQLTGRRAPVFRVIHDWFEQLP